jgi:hypothetical protein
MADIPVAEMEAHIEKTIASLDRVGSDHSIRIGIVAQKGYDQAKEHRNFLYDDDDADKDAANREYQRDLAMLSVWLGIIKMGWI